MWNVDSTLHHHWKFEFSSSFASFVLPSVLNEFLGIVFTRTAGHVPHLTLSCFCSLHLSNQCWQVSGIVVTHALYVGQMSFAPNTPDTYLLSKQSSWFNLQLKRCKERSLKLISNFLAFPVKHGEIIWPSVKKSCRALICSLYPQSIDPSVDFNMRNWKCYKCIFVLE